jgi:hypothetical protein
MCSVTTAAERPPALPLPLQEGEQVLQLCRKHWLYLWPNLALLVLIAVAPVALVVWLFSVAGVLDGVVASIVWLVAAVYLAFSALRIFLAWYAYHNDVWVVTNQRLIDSHKRNPFNLRLSTADLVNVQDMTVSRSGILRTLFDYGDVICQTAAEQQDIMISGVPDPRAVQALVDRERDRERLRHATPNLTGL